MDLAGQDLLRSFSLDEFRQMIDSGSTSFRWIHKEDFSETAEQLYRSYVIRGGLPIMLSNTLKGWNPSGEQGEYNWARLPDLFGADTSVKIRDNRTFEDIDMTYREYARYLEDNAPDVEPRDSRLMYGKDMVAPQEWIDALNRNMPAAFLERQGGDLLACRSDPAFAPQTLMTYVGVNGTYTCGHFDLCASLGHNLVLDSDEGPTSIWVIARQCDQEAAVKFFEYCGGSLVKDNCFLSLGLIARAPFPVYVAFQGKGDFVLLPPNAAHQVFNKGRNVKISWNRMPTTSIEEAYFVTLPRYRLVARCQTYKIAGLAFIGMKDLANDLSAALGENPIDLARVRSIGKQLRHVLNVSADAVWNEIIDENDPLWERNKHGADPRREILSGAQMRELVIRNQEDDLDVRCDVCRADIFNRFVHCEDCEKDFCGKCVGNLRGCFRQHRHVIVQRWPFETLLQEYHKAYGVFLQASNVCKKIHPVTPPDHLMNSGARSDMTMAALVITSRIRFRHATCHACKRVPSREDPQLCCSRCSLSFCEACIWNRQTELFIECFKQKGWVCYACLNKCNCAQCVDGMKFRSFDTFNARAVDQIDTSLLAKSDVSLPSLFVKGMSFLSRDGSVHCVAPYRAYPPPVEWLSVTAGTPLMARHPVSGKYFSARRALLAEENRCSTPNLRGEVLVALLKGNSMQVEDVVWCMFDQVTIKPTGALMKQHGLVKASRVCQQLEAAKAEKRRKLELLKNSPKKKNKTDDDYEEEDGEEEEYFDDDEEEEEREKKKKQQHQQQQQKKEATNKKRKVEQPGEDEANAIVGESKKGKSRPEGKEKAVLRSRKRDVNDEDWVEEEAVSKSKKRDVKEEDLVEEKEKKSAAKGKKRAKKQELRTPTRLRAAAAVAKTKKSQQAGSDEPGKSHEKPIRVHSNAIEDKDEEGDVLEFSDSDERVSSGRKQSRKETPKSSALSSEKSKKKEKEKKEKKEKEKEKEKEKKEKEKKERKEKEKKEKEKKHKAKKKKAKTETPTTTTTTVMATAAITTTTTPPTRTTTTTNAQPPLTPVAADQRATRVRPPSAKQRGERELAGLLKDAFWE